MGKETIKEQIKYYTELMKIAWIVLIAVSGGVASIILSDKPKARSEEELILLFLGVVYMVLAFLSILKLNRDIHILLKKLSELEQEE